MIPEVGKSIWIMLFACASTSDTEYKRENFVNMVISLFKCFPCEECKKHFNYLDIRVPIRDYVYKGSTTENCLAYVADLHNMIEFIMFQEGKKKNPNYITWNDVKEKWLKECSQCKVN